MNEEELKEWKLLKKTEAYEEFVKTPLSLAAQDMYRTRLKAIDEIKTITNN